MSMINENNNIINDTPKKTDDMEKYRKEYYENNKEKFKLYYQENKEKYKNPKDKKLCSICGSSVVKRNFNTHLKSKKHIDAVKIKEMEDLLNKK